MRKPNVASKGSWKLALDCVRHRLIFETCTYSFFISSFQFIEPRDSNPSIE